MGKITVEECHARDGQVIEGLKVITPTVFGDNRNDLALFAAADEAIAVANAVPELRAAADRVIGANDDDGVALYLKEVYKL